MQDSVGRDYPFTLVCLDLEDVAMQEFNQLINVLFYAILSEMMDGKCLCLALFTSIELMCK